MQMPYGGFYPNYYMQPDPIQQYKPQQQIQMPQDNRIWVQGEVGAKAYLVAPGNTVVLWDSETPAIYLKTITSSGMPTLQKLVYTMDTEPQKPVPDMSMYVTKDYLDERLKAFIKPQEVNHE